MTITEFLNAMIGLQHSLRQQDVTRNGDLIEVHLSAEAGTRFEAWYVHSVGPAVAVEQVKLIAGDEPRRAVEVAGVRIIWPVERVILRNGQKAVRPLLCREYTTCIAPDGAVSYRPMVGTEQGAAA